MKRISVITVNYNGFALTCALIDSLRRHIAQPLEIVVVDNGSVVDEAALLRARYADITVIRSEQNLGFAGGNNLGIAAASGDYLLFLNNDTEVEDDSLLRLAEQLDQAPELGGISPKIRFFAPPRTIQFAGYTPLTTITLRNRLLGFGEPEQGQYDSAHETPYLHGAAMLIRREAIARAGAMPEMYFLYYEELDWSARLREAGYRLGYAPCATIFHKESATTGQQSPLRTYYITRNRLLFARRNRQGAQRTLAIGYQLGIALPKSLVVSLLHRRFDLIKAALAGAWDFVRAKTGKR